MNFNLFGLIVLSIMLALFVLHIVSVVWAYNDALRNGRDSIFAIIVAIGILFFPVAGFIVYLFIRKA
ncbi:hypothetical protein ACH33_08600 [Aneurinibacillus sp. XH2]|nr:hypothetical protein ACH33_08600 [Aneurinibacillus sp. XH2]